jgi:plasmid stabilization system protein ParE
MSRTLRVFARAGRDLDSIYDWIAERSPQGADTWYEAFADAVAEVVASPERFGRASEGTHWKRDIRESIFKTRLGKRYRIVFELVPDEIRILRVRGPGQLPLRARDIPKR